MNQINPYRHGGEALAFDGFGNRSRSFDGVDDYITVQDGSWIPTGAQTWACWIKPDADSIVTFFNHNVGTGNQRSVNIITYTGGVIYAQLSPDGVTTIDAASPSSTYITGEWIHVAFTFTPSSSTGLKLYINGSLETVSNVSSISSVHNSTADVGIGANGLGQAPFQGNICDCRIYDTDLTATDISDIYNGTNITTNFVGHWLTDADNVLDAAGTNHGTNYGTKYSYDNPSPPVEFGSASRSFDGVDDYVDANSISSLNNATSFSLGFWCKKTASNNVVSVGSRVEDTNGFWLSWWSDGNIYATIRNAEILTSSYSLPYTSEWVYLSMTFDGSQIEASRVKIYVNGSLAATGSGASSLSSNGADNFLIGLWNSVYSNGNIADVRLYDTDLTASQVSDLYAGTDVQTNLVGHWLTDNDDVEDKAGTNDGTNFGSTYSYDNPPMDLIPSRQASRSFNGSSDYVDLGNDSSLDFTSRLTMSFWIKPESSHNGAILSKWTSGLSAVFTNAYTCYFGQDAANDRLKFIVQQSNGTKVTLSDSTVLPLSQWSHVVCKADGSNLSVFIDGQSSSSVSYDGTIDVDPVKLLIGKLRQTDSVYTFDGKIADVRIYDTDLTSSQILAIYNGTTDRTNLVGQWLTNSDDVLDHAGTNDGTNNGSTYSTDSPS